MVKFALLGLLLLSACTYYNGPAATEPHGSVGSTKDVQGKLQQQGLYHGAVDGIVGPETKAAVHSYQQSQHLTPTGHLDSATLNSLNQ